MTSITTETACHGHVEHVCATHRWPIVLALCLLTVSGCGPEPQPPNVLFIGVDDLNDWVGVLGGHPQTETPNLDRLAAEGVLFTNAHTAAPACNPSRAALMSGLRPSTTGVYHNDQPWRDAIPDAVTLPQYFMNHGYYVLGSGKMYHDRYPDPPSWHEYAPALERQRFPDPPSPGNRNGLDKSHFDWGGIQVADSAMADTKTVDWVIEQLDRDFDAPFFLACGIYRPHLPWYVPQGYFDALPLDSIVLPTVPPDDLDDIPQAGLDMIRFNDHEAVTGADQWPAAVQGYLASIRYVDGQLGRLLAALESSPHAKNTIVVLWTDHGWHLGEKQHWRKFALWEEATRVPLVVIVPEGAPGLEEGTSPGGRSERPVSLLDLYPSLLELAGLEKKEGLEGASLVPLLRDPQANREEPALITHGRGNHAIRTDRWRYIRYADGSEELYDHLADSSEYRNLASDTAFAKVIEDLGRWMPESNAPDAARR